MRYFYLILFSSVLVISCANQKPTNSRTIKEITLKGSGYDLGYQHGAQLKTEIAAIVHEWKKNTSKNLNIPADKVISDFFKYADFTASIKKYTPELYEEIRGIAAGSEQKFNDVFVLNLLDEFWVYIDDPNKHHCSGLGVPEQNGNPGYISQNMDLENYTDGFQVLMRLERNKSRPEQLILTHPGLIALNGLNEAGIGVCVNTIMQLKAAPTGLPVAFFVRQLLNQTNKQDVLSVLTETKHASGQNYILGIRGEVFDFEASANKVVRFNPNNENGSVYHTNHPIVNDDLKSWHNQYNPSNNISKQILTSNSYQRLEAVQNRIASLKDIDNQIIKETLRSKDFKNNPVCRQNNNDGRGFTFASVIMTFTEVPTLQLVAGPPDEAKFEYYHFSKN